MTATTLLESRSLVEPTEPREPVDPVEQDGIDELYQDHGSPVGAASEQPAGRSLPSRIRTAIDRAGDAAESSNVPAQYAGTWSMGWLRQELVSLADEVASLERELARKAVDCG